MRACADKFYHLAKEQGYRSRASFKLIQLNKKYDLLSKARVVLDLCGAPGSWAQVCSKTCPTSAMIVCVDIVKIAPLPNVICLQEDITTEKCKAAIKKHVKTFKVDLVLNDGAPNVGQNWQKDAYNQSELTLEALKLATQFLATGGNFVTKIFRSQDYNALLWVFNQLFKRVEASKPQASRNESAEIFVVCLGYLAPKKIDPKLLDPRHVFAELDVGPAKKANVLQKDHAKKNRDGYETGVTLLYKEISATDFVRAEDAVQVLSDYNKIVFLPDSEADQALLEHEKTDAETKFACGDLRVLGKGDFRKLLRWRDAVREVVCEPEEQEEEASEEEVEEDEDERLAREMGDLKKAAALRDKRRKRKERERKARNQQRIDLKIDIVGDQIETQEDLGLFSGTERGKKALAADTASGLQDVLAAKGGEFSPSEAEDEDDASSEDEDDMTPAERDEYRLRKMNEREDAMYADYCRRNGIDKQMNKKRRRGKGGDAEDLDAYVPDLTRDITEEERQGSDGDVEEEGEEEEEGAGGAGMAAKAGLSSRWFSQPIFNHFGASLHTPAAVQAVGADDRSVKKAKGPSQANKMGPVAGPEMPGPLVSSGASSGGGGPRQDQEDDAFEEVAASDSDLSSLDSEGEAEVAAMGALLLKKKMRKEELIDSCYHRYAFNDTALAPAWFQDDQRKFTTKILPVTKEQIQEERERNMAIAARPIKKVMEAKARKKIKLVRAAQKASNKADQVANDTDLSDKAKMRALQKLYDKGVAVKRPRAVSVIGRKGAVGKGKGTKIVDKRMKKDHPATIRPGNRNFKGGKKGSKQKAQMKVRATQKQGGVKKRSNGATMQNGKYR